jgi:hypothetical protein
VVVQEATGQDETEQASSRTARPHMEEIVFNSELKGEKDERTWNVKLQRLKKYKRMHGDCLVPIKNHVEDKELSIWVTHQRNHYKRGTIPNHRIQQLKQVGFVWSIVETENRGQELSWEKSFEKLREFWEVRGHFIVPPTLENGKTNPLTSWVFTQRKVYAKGQLKEDRRLKLEAIDFIWNQVAEHYSEQKWNAAFSRPIQISRGERAHIRGERRWHGTLAMDQKDDLET